MSLIMVIMLLAAIAAVIVAVEDHASLSDLEVLLSVTAAKTSILVFESDPAHDEFDSFVRFHEEPDAVVVAAKDNYCFVSFRGTIATLEDWAANFQRSLVPACYTKSDGEEICCEVSRGFWDVYYATYVAEMEAAIKECTDTYCVGDKASDCLVFTGYSQGAGVAAVAALLYEEFIPYVITFGQPSAIQAPCSLVHSDRLLRYVNTRRIEGAPFRFGRFTISMEGFGLGIGYDMFSQAPAITTDYYGRLMILPPDNSTGANGAAGVTYIGIDNQETFRVRSWEAHDMIESPGEHPEYYPGYLDHLNRLQAFGNSTSFPIALTGFADGTLCSDDRECQTGKCQRSGVFGTFSFFSYRRCRP